MHTCLRPFTYSSSKIHWTRIHWLPSIYFYFCSLMTHHCCCASFLIDVRSFGCVLTYNQIICFIKPWFPSSLCCHFYLVSLHRGQNCHLHLNLLKLICIHLHHKYLHPWGSIGSKITHSGWGEYIFSFCHQYNLMTKIFDRIFLTKAFHIA